jgi:hypothetical protein
VHFWPAEGDGENLPIPLHLRLGSRLAYFRERLQHVTVLHNRPTRSESYRRVYFNKRFRRSSGMSPTAFRAQSTR